MPDPALATGLRERHKQQRRGRILTAIRELLRERPDETPTVERIAELADLSPATVFNLVGPREQQWAALCEELLGELDTCLAFAAEEDPLEQARKIVSDTAELFIADAAVFRHIVNSWERSGSLLQENPVPRLRAALRQWAAGQISDAAFRRRVRFAVDVVFAAGASEDWATELSAPLARKGRRGSR